MINNATNKIRINKAIYHNFQLIPLKIVKILIHIRIQNKLKYKKVTIHLNSFPIYHLKVSRASPLPLIPFWLVTTTICINFNICK